MTSEGENESNDGTFELTAALDDLDAWVDDVVDIDDDTEDIELVRLV